MKEKDENSKKKGIIIVLLLLFLFLIGAVVFYTVYRKSENSKPSNSSAPLINEVIKNKQILAIKEQRSLVVGKNSQQILKPEITANPETKPEATSKSAASNPVPANGLKSAKALKLKPIEVSENMSGGTELPLSKSVPASMQHSDLTTAAKHTVSTGEGHSKASQKDFDTKDTNQLSISSDSENISAASPNISVVSNTERNPAGIVKLPLKQADLTDKNDSFTQTVPSETSDGVPHSTVDLKEKPASESNAH